jgi:prolyl-tRNA synthetase
MFERARQFREASTRRAETYAEMKEMLEKQGGFVRAWFTPSRDTAPKNTDDTTATVRCIPYHPRGGRGKDTHTGEETGTEVLFAVAY